MGFNFDAEAQAVPEEKGEGEEPPEENEDKNDNLDREMGEVDLGAGGKLDEKMWNGDDEDDKDKPEDKGEQGKDQKEDIEGHGAEGEGEEDTTTPEEGNK